MGGPRLPVSYAASLLICLLVCLLFFRASRKSTLQNILTESVKGSTFCGNLEIPSPRLACKPSEPQANSLIVAVKMQMCRTRALPLREQGRIHVDITASLSRHTSTLRAAVQLGEFPDRLLDGSDPVAGVGGR